MRIILSAQEFINITLIITLLDLQAQSAALELPLLQLLVSFTSLPCLCNLAIAYILSYLTIGSEAPLPPTDVPAESSADHHAKPETTKRSTSAARMWREWSERASSQASFSDASSGAFSFPSSSSSGADSSSSGSLPPAESLPKPEQGTAIVDSKAGELQLLGEGASGKVYVDGSDVVKMILCESRKDEIMAQWELMCMESASQGCSNVVMPRGLAVEDRPEGTVALLRMERCAGSLQDFLETVPEGSPLEACEAFALKVLLQAAQGVAAVHATGLVHADIKPANLLLKEFPASLESPLPQGAVKVCDFGLAFAEKDGETCEPLGTPGYMAPEVEALGLESEEAPAALTAKIDVYSLGCTLLDAILMARPCMEGGADVSLATGALINGMTAQDPEERLSTKEVLELICSHPLLAF